MLSWWLGCSNFFIKKVWGTFCCFCLIGLSFLLEKKAETVKNMQIDIRTPFQKTFFERKRERKFASKEVDVIIINAKPVSYGLCFIRSWQAECKVLTSLNKRTSVTEALFGTKMCKKYFVKNKEFYTTSYFYFFDRC